MQKLFFAIVELNNGEQFFGDTPYEAFKFAKEAEAKKRNSVEYVIFGDFDENEPIKYEGQELRYMLRALDNTTGWIKAQLEAQHQAAEDDEETYRL